MVMAQEAPRTVDHLCSECRDHWEKLLSYLQRLEVPFTVEPRLVRGLDYYTRTVFEIQPPEEGGQSTICAGGRYDGLIQELDGPPTPGIGFAAGMERMVLNLKRQSVPVPEENSRKSRRSLSGRRGQGDGDLPGISTPQQGDGGYSGPRGP